jgi:hypothetical protein
MYPQNNKRKETLKKCKRKTTQLKMSKIFKKTSHLKKKRYTHGLKLAWANSLQDPISKIPNTKKVWWNGLSDRVPA